MRCPTPLLGRVPDPIYGEHAAGYLRRLAIANGLQTPRHLLMLIDVYQIASTSGDDLWAKLAQAAGVDAATFEPVRWRRSGSGLSQFVGIDGHSVRNTFVELLRLRVCPSCLVERGTTWNRFHLRHVTACPRHRQRLIDACTSCERRLSPVDPCHLWTCRSCHDSLADARPELASAADIAISSSLLGLDRACAGDLPSGFLALDLNARIAVVERLGSLNALADDDQPVSTFRSSARPVVIKGDPSLNAIRAKVEGAYHLLGDWPGEYEALLERLLDRNGSPPKGTAIQRRMATAAGSLAIRPLVAEGDRPIGFVHEATQAFFRRHLAFAKSYRLFRSAKAAFAGFDHLAEPATLSLIGYATVVEAATALNGKGDDIRSWLEAGLVHLHRHDDGGMAVPQADIEAALKRLADLPDQPTDGAWEHRPTFINPVLSRYRRADLIKDIFAGEVKAVVRDRSATGLASLAFCRSDLTLRHSMAIIGSWLVRDDYMNASVIAERAGLLWGPVGMVKAQGRDGLIGVAGIRRRSPRYSCRDVIQVIQKRTGFQVFETFHDEPPSPGATWRATLHQPCVSRSNLRHPLEP